MMQRQRTREGGMLSNSCCFSCVDHLYPSGLGGLRSPTQIRLNTITILAEAVSTVVSASLDDHSPDDRNVDVKRTAISDWFRGLEAVQWATSLTIPAAIRRFAHLLESIDPDNNRILSGKISLILQGQLDPGPKQSQMTISAALTSRRDVNLDFVAPAATGSLVAARIRKQRPGPKPEDHTKFYRVIIETLGSSGGPSDD